MDKLEVLRRCELFRDLNAEQLAVVEKLCTSQIFEAGEIIGKQGSKLDNIYVIEEGAAGIILEVGPLSQRQVQAASNYDVVCWSGIVEPHVCTATVKALEKTKVLAISGEELLNLCIPHPEIGCRICRAVAQIVARRLRQAYTQLLGVSSQD